jgi:hypothetical protein
MSDYKIEKNVPMPTSTTHYKYPWVKMEVGDAFVVDAVDVNKVRSASVQWSNTHDETFKLRKGFDGIYRCWRIK